MIDPSHLALQRRIPETQRLLKDVASYDIDPRLKTLIRKALKTSILADMQAITAQPDKDQDDRRSPN